MDGSMSLKPAFGTGETFPAAREITSIDADFIEVALLLPRWQAAALQVSARQQGMSAGQMLRRIIVATVGNDARAHG